MLTKRQKKILRYIVRSYVDTAVPVASNHLVKQYSLDCSPATVRNEMAALEDMELVKQPHTSAGRVPTSLGYRYFVDHLMTPEPLNKRMVDQICQPLKEAEGNVSVILEQASRLLGRISLELGVVLTPWMSGDRFDRMEFMPLTREKVLVVIHVRSRLVKTVILEMETELSDAELTKTASVLNERLSGLTLDEIRQTIGDRVRDVHYGSRALVRRTVDEADRLFNFTEPLEVHTCGTQNIISQPEFSSSVMLSQILSLVDDRRHLIRVFHRPLQDTEVMIGDENDQESLKSFTVIASRYVRGKHSGTLGVIGPQRMPYHRILPLVQTVSQTVSEFLC